MKRLKDLSKMVKAILEKDKAARNSDSILLLHLLRDIGNEHGIDIDRMSVPMLLIHGRDLGLPTLESVGRARRKVVEAHPELGSDDDVEAVKMQLEEAYRDFARSVHYV
jgi:hypothetical protein